MSTAKLRGKINRALEEIDTPLPTLAEALSYLQARHCSIHYDVERIIDIYAPGRKLAISVRRAVRKYHEPIIERMAAGDASVCPTTWHEKYWRDGICEICRRLEPSINPSHPDVMKVG